MSEKERIVYIDLAKGFCIILVVFCHVVKTKYFFDDALRIFRMPLYFFLSGLFFKQYGGMLDFIRRKTNKLLIPFLFFMISYALLCMFLAKYNIVENPEKFWGWNNFTSLYHEEVKNGPIWFLLCLFIVNIYFYIIFTISKRLGSKYVWLIIIISIILGTVGYILGKHHVEWPLYTDTALTALPYFCLGYILNRKTNFLRPNKSDRYIFIMIIAAAIILALFSKPVIYSNNFYETSLLATYACGIAGTLGVIMISKIIKHLPLITFIGRYSIVILCTHQPIAQIFITVLGKTMKKGEFMDLTVFILTVITCGLITPLMVRYLPHVTAQKDVF